MLFLMEVTGRRVFDDADDLWGAKGWLGRGSDVVVML